MILVTTYNVVIDRVNRNRHSRPTHLGVGGAAAVNAWLTLRGDAPGALICPITQRGAVELRRMSGQAVRDALRRRARVSTFSRTIAAAL